MTEVPPPEVSSWRERIELLASPSTASPAQVALAVAGVAAVAVLAWLLLRQPAGAPVESSLPHARPATTTTMKDEVVVHAAGAVARPGVYRLSSGARVDDLLRAAGGASPDADLDRVNLAAPVADGSRVYVARTGEPVPAAAGGTGSDASGETGPVDLNTATLEQLDDLPGVGPATAKAIIDERTKRGRFGSVEDLLNVRGIGPAKLDALRDLVTV